MLDTEYNFGIMGKTLIGDLFMNAQQAIEHALKDLVSNNKQFTNYDVTKHARSFTDDNVKHTDVIAHVSVEMDEKDGYYVDTVYVNKGSTRVAAVIYSPDDMFIYQYSSDNIQTNKSLKNSSCCGGSATTCFSSGPINAAINAAYKAAATVKKFQNHSSVKIDNCTFGLIPQSNQTKSGHNYTTVVPRNGVVSSNNLNKNGTIREVMIDNRGRICIPKSFINRIGKNAGDVVYVQKSSVKGKLLISAIQWSASSCIALTTNQVDCYGNVRVTPRSLNACNVTKTTKNGSEFVTVRSESDHIVIE